MKTTIFFDEYTFAEARIKILTQKQNFLRKKFAASPSAGERLRNFWSSYFACKYGGSRSTLQKTNNPDSLRSCLKLLGAQGLK